MFHLMKLIRAAVNDFLLFIYKSCSILSSNSLRIEVVYCQKTKTLLVVLYELQIVGDSRNTIFTIY